MKPKSIDLSNKCGSCDHFDPIDGTCSGYCLRNKYGEDVYHDPEHPYWQVQRSRLKCVYYNKKPKTNADHIRSMTDEELAWRTMQLNFCPPNIDEYKVCGKDANCHQCWVDWLKQPFDGGDT